MLPLDKGAAIDKLTAQSLTLPFAWRQGEHMAIVGPTGSGKSVLAARLVEARKWRIIIRTKDDDVTYRDAETVGTVAGIERRAARNDPNTPPRRAFVLDPDYDAQADEIWRAMEYAWRAGGWAVYLDELFYAAELGLERQVNKLLTQGRSRAVTMINGTQRPSKVPRFAFSEASHLICFGLEGRDVKVIDESAGRKLADAIVGLKRYEFAWWSVRERRLWIGRLNMRSGRLEPVER